MTQTRVFVFGSNLAGRHGAGAAKEAIQNWGAIYGQGVGRQGNSYAIPTKDQNLRTLPLRKIRQHCRDFMEYARQHPECIFHLTAIGTGLAGYQPRQIAPFLARAPDNVKFPKEFVYIREKKHGKR